MCLCCVCVQTWVSSSQFFLVLFRHSTDFYLGVYAALGMSQGFMVMFASILLAVGSINGARLLHRRLLVNILRSPMSFFDTTPLGRIVNRFSKDIYLIDEAIPRSLRMFIAIFFSVISTIVVISYSTPIFLSAVLPLAIIYVLTQVRMCGIVITTQCQRGICSSCGVDVVIKLSLVGTHCVG